MPGTSSGGCDIGFASAGQRIVGRGARRGRNTDGPGAEDQPARNPAMIFKSRLQGWQKLLPYALLLSVTLALYGSTLYFYFVWDDHYYITTNYRIHGLSWVHLQAIWTNTYLGHYAPVQHTFLAILYYFSGLEPFNYHLAQLVVHAAGVVLLYGVLKKVESPRVALLASLLFAVHPTS